MSEPKTYLRMGINIGAGPHDLNYDLDGTKITESTIVQLFDDAKRSAIDHFRKVKDTASMESKREEPETV